MSASSNDKRPKPPEQANDQEMEAGDLENVSGGVIEGGCIPVWPPVQKPPFPYPDGGPFPYIPPDTIA